MQQEVLLIKIKVPLPGEAALLTKDPLPLESVLQEGNRCAAREPEGRRWGPAGSPWIHLHAGWRAAAQGSLGFRRQRPPKRLRH